MNYTHKFISILAALLLSSGLVFAAGQAESPADPADAGESAVEAVTIRAGGLKGPTSISLAPYIVDPERVGDGVRVATEIFASPDMAVSQILSGEIDMASLPTNLASVLYNRDAGIQLLGISGQGLLYLLADRDMELVDIAGETVHTLARGATPDIMLQTLAGGYGLHAGEDYTIQYAANPTELAQNLIAGRVNLAVLPEPFVTRVTQAREELRPAVNLQDVFAEQYALDYYPMTAIVVRTAFAEKHPQAVAAWAADMGAAQEWLTANLPTAAEAAGEEIGVPAGIIQSAFDRLNLTWIPAAEARDEVQTYLQIFADVNQDAVGGSLPAEDFYY